MHLLLSGTLFHQHRPVSPQEQPPWYTTCMFFPEIEQAHYFPGLSRYTVDRVLVVSQQVQFCDEFLAQFHIALTERYLQSYWFIS